MRAVRRAHSQSWFHFEVPVLDALLLDQDGLGQPSPPERDAPVERPHVLCEDRHVEKRDAPLRSVTPYPKRDATLSKRPGDLIKTSRDLI